MRYQQCMGWTVIGTQTNTLHESPACPMVLASCTKSLREFSARSQALEAVSAALRCDRDFDINGLQTLHGRRFAKRCPLIRRVGPARV